MTMAPQDDWDIGRDRFDYRVRDFILIDRFQIGRCLRNRMELFQLCAHMVAHPEKEIRFLGDEMARTVWGVLVRLMEEKPVDIVDLSKALPPQSEGMNYPMYLAECWDA